MAKRKQENWHERIKYQKEFIPQQSQENAKHYLKLEQI